MCHRLAPARDDPGRHGLRVFVATRRNVRHHRTKMKTDITPENESWSIRFLQLVTVGLATFVLYGLSTGPAWWLHKHGVLSHSGYCRIYQPIGYAIEHSPGDIVFRYIDWWSPVIKF
jgi:hypothetical protein